MNIIVNGESRKLKMECSAQQMLEVMGFADKRVALEINMEIVPRSHYGQTFIAEGDKIEIVRAIGGG